MTIDTEYRRALLATRMTLAELHRLTGVSLNTLRSLSSGRNAHPQRRTRAKLAAALRAHSAELARLADQLDPA